MLWDAISRTRVLDSGFGSFSFRIGLVAECVSFVWAAEAIEDVGLGVRRRSEESRECLWEIFGQRTVGRCCFLDCPKGGVEFVAAGRANPQPRRASFYQY